LALSIIFESESGSECKRQYRVHSAPFDRSAREFLPQRRHHPRGWRLARRIQPGF